VRQAIEAGAVGFLLKETAAAELLKAIREVHSGNAFFSPPIAKRLRDHTRNAGAPEKEVLTLREAQVLQLIADGCPNKRIAAELGISIKTVEKHRQQVMNKLGIHHTAGLTRFVLNRAATRPDLPPRRSAQLPEV
jgi:DNA-binding NarL/FixJ family response regulator